MSQSITDSNVNAKSIKTVRDSSFELLRIVSMFCIVICHFASHGGFDYNIQSVSIPRLWWYFIEMGGNFGVDVFVLISGYFLVVSKGGFFDLKRILKFWGQVFFYSITIYLIFGFTGACELSFSSLVKTVLPMIYERWWFASTYFVLFLLHPFLNIVLNKLDKRAYQVLLTILILMWCIIPTLTLTQFQGNNLLWFITLYCVAGYIRLFGLNPKFTLKHYVFFWLLFSALRYISAVVLIVLGRRIPFAADHTLIFYETQSIFTFLSALSLFMVFKNVKMGHHKWINIIASASFGVYLIHDNKLVRPFLWETVFKNVLYQDTLLIIPYSIGVACLIYAVCTGIDLIRQYSIEKGFLYIVNRWTDKLEVPFKKVVCFFQGIVFGKRK